MSSVTILGYGNLAYNPATCTTDEQWGFNTSWRFFDATQFDRWFDLHDLDAMYGGLFPKVRRDKEHLRWCRKPNTRLHLFEPWATEYGAEPFPADDLIGEFGPVFANSAAWLLGYAMHSGFTDIRMDGWQLEDWYEKAFERPSVAYLAGVAEGRGVEVSGLSWLVEPWQYGLEQRIDPRWRVRREASRVKKPLRRAMAEINVILGHDRYGSRFGRDIT